MERRNERRLRRDKGERMVGFRSMYSSKGSSKNNSFSLTPRYGNGVGKNGVFLQGQALMEGNKGGERKTVFSKNNVAGNKQRSEYINVQEMVRSDVVQIIGLNGERKDSWNPSPWITDRNARGEDDATPFNP